MFFSGLNQGGVSKKEIIKYEIGDHHTEIKKQNPPRNLGRVLIAILGDPNRVRAGSAERTRLGDGGGSSY